jgi:hypothetical protein
MTIIKVGSKVKIIQYKKDRSMNGRIGIVMKIGIHPDTSCVVKIDGILLRFKGLKNLRLIEKKKYDIDLDNMSDKEVLSEILKTLIIMNNKIYKKMMQFFCSIILYNLYYKIYIYLFQQTTNKQTNKNLLYPLLWNKSTKCIVLKHGLLKSHHTKNSVRKLVLKEKICVMLLKPLLKPLELP